MPPVLATRSTALCYRRADFDGLRNALRATPWDLLDGMNPDEAVSLFYTIVDGAVRDYVPTVTMKKRFPPWFDGSVRRALKLKQVVFERLKRHPGDEFVKTDFARKRAEFKRLSSDSHDKYLSSLVSDFSTNPKRFWTFLKCFKQSKAMSVLEDRGVQIADDVGRANLLNRTFARKFFDPKVTHFPNSSPVTEADQLSGFTVSVETVRDLLKNLPLGKACGPDGLSSRLLRECSDELAIPLSKIYSSSLSSGIFPEQWAEANIVPIFKKGSRKSPENYRSVSLLPLCAKVFEKAVSQQLMHHVQPLLTQSAWVYSRPIVQLEPGLLSVLRI